MNNCYNITLLLKAIQHKIIQNTEPLIFLEKVHHRAEKVDMNMKKMTRLTRALITAAIAFQTVALQAGPHVHGEAQLTIAMENTSLQIQLIAPASDVVGFEHQPTTSKELKSFADAKDALSQVAGLFVMTGGRCKLFDVEINMSGAVDAQHDAHEHHAVHNNIAASYDFQCVSLEELSKIEINFFDMFPAILRINSIWINERSQGSQVLTKATRQIHVD